MLERFDKSGPLFGREGTENLGLLSSGSGGLHTLTRGKNGVTASRYGNRLRGCYSDKGCGLLLDRLGVCLQLINERKSGLIIILQCCDLLVSIGKLLTQSCGLCISGHELLPGFGELRMRALQLFVQCFHGVIF